MPPKEGITMETIGRAGLGSASYLDLAQAV